MPRKQLKAAKRRKRMRIQIFSGAALALLLIVALPLALHGMKNRGLTPPLPSPGPAVTEAEATETAEATIVPAVEPTATPKPTVPPEPTATPVPDAVSITISAAGDCTLGGDMLGPSEARFAKFIKDSGDPNGYCFKNVKSIFEQDDLTIVNLEVVLTDSGKYNPNNDPSKIFIMRGKPSYAKMLPANSIEIANISNNHINDFGDAGVDETIQHLTENGVDYFGYGHTLVKEVKGVRVGFAGFNTWTTKDSAIEGAIKDLRKQCDVLIVSFHWGSELKYVATDKQIAYAHKAVDLGADLVLGHHPHVVNGIEVYKGVNIVYSLGNFVFGGKADPKDKDTFIYQHTFTVQGGKIVGNEPKVIPCKITSVKDESSNNYQPIPVTGAKAEAILKKIESYSKQFNEALKLGR